MKFKVWKHVAHVEKAFNKERILSELRRCSGGGTTGYRRRALVTH